MDKSSKFSLKNKAARPSEKPGRFICTKQRIIPEPFQSTFTAMRISNLKLSAYNPHVQV
jgi:hypothetical protein